MICGSVTIMSTYTYLNDLPDDAVLIHRTAQGVKAIGNPDEGRVGGYLVAWGNPQQRDLHGEYFTEQTDFALDWYPSRPALYHHGLDGQMQSALIGAITSIKADSVGLWAEAQLNMHNRYVQAIMQMVEKGALGWSSGSLPHLVEVDTNGQIKRWPIVEGSLTPTPAEPQRTTVGAIKSLIEINVISAAAEAEEPCESETEELPECSFPAETEAPELESEGENMDPREMLNGLLAAVLQAKPEWTLTPEEASAIVENVAAQMASADAQMAAPAPTPAAQVNFTGKAAPVLVAALSAHFDGKAAEAARVKGLYAQSVENILASIPAPAAAAAPMFTGAQKRAMGEQTAPRISDVQDMKYDHLSAEAALFAAKTLQSGNVQPSETLLRVAATKTLRAAERGNATFEPAMKALGYLKADEVISTNLSGYGQDWVGVAYDNNLWEKARAAVVYQSLLNKGAYEVAIPQGVNSIVIPAEGTDPTWYSMPEQNDEDAVERLPIAAKSSKPSTTSRTLTPAQMGAMVRYTDIFDEDNFIRAAQFLANQMNKSAQENLEYVLLNGDTVTTASTNLNLIDGTPSVDGKGRGPAYLTFSGMLKLPIITTTALSRDCGVGFDESDFIDTMKLLPKAERQDRAKLLFVTDSDTALAALNISTIKTRDVFSAATLESGMLTRIFAVDVLESAQIPLANTAGKVSTTAGNNTKGRILLVRADQWAIGYKRRIRMETVRDVEAQATSVICTLRVGLTSRTTSGAAAATYNVPV